MGSAKNATKTRNLLLIVMVILRQFQFGMLFERNELANHFSVQISILIGCQNMRLFDILFKIVGTIGKP